MELSKKAKILTGRALCNNTITAQDDDAMRHDWQGAEKVFFYKNEGDSVLNLCTLRFLHDRQRQKAGRS